MSTEEGKKLENPERKRTEKGKEYLAQFLSSSLSYPPNILTGLLFQFPRILVLSFQQFVLACIHVEEYSSQNKYLNRKLV